jgi:enamine deaminase RidA (YjgF/YER057c/UK114 family)
LEDSLMDRINPGTLLPPPGGRFAHAVMATAGSRVAVVAGQVALDRHGKIVGTGEHALQAQQCFVNLRHVLDALGARSQDIAQLTIYIVGYEPSMLAGIDAAGDAGFVGDWPIAATTLVGVAALGLPDFLVEVSATVALPG